MHLTHDPIAAPSNRWLTGPRSVGVVVSCVLAWSAPMFAQMDAQASLALRDGEPTPSGRITAISIGGVTITSPEGDQPKVVTLGWDRIAEVNGAEAQSQAKDFLALAEPAWRARIRLSRGDAPGAEPLLEPLFARLEGQSGPTACTVASGLLRCRLVRQAQSAAVRPWLALVASGEPETIFDTPQIAADGIVVSPVTDTSTGLAPALPPIWLPGPSLQAMMVQGKGAPATTPGASSPARLRANLLGDLYIASARALTGQPVAITPRPSSDAAVTLVWDVVAATAGTTEQRAEARGQLALRLADEQIPQWMEAWCRVALGRSMLKDGDADQKLLGMVHLLNVPARLDQVSPYLAGVAIVDVAQAQERMGHADAAARLWRQLEDRFPGHPAMAMRAVHDAVGPAGAGDNGPKGGGGGT